MIASRSVSIWTSNEKSHRNVFSVAFSLSVCRLRKGVCGTGGLVRLNRAGGSSCLGGKFFAEPQRGVALCGARETAAPAAGAKRKGHLRFPFLFELLPFPCFLIWRRLPICDRFEKEYGSRVTSAFVSQHIRSSQIDYCYTYGLLYAGCGITVPHDSSARCYGQFLRR